MHAGSLLKKASISAAHGIVAQAHAGLRPVQGWNAYKWLPPLLQMAMGQPPHADLHPMRVLFLIPKEQPPHLPDHFSQPFCSFIAACLQKVGILSAWHPKVATVLAGRQFSLPKRCCTTFSVSEGCFGQQKCDNHQLFYFPAPAICKQAGRQPCLSVAAFQKRLSLSCNDAVASSVAGLHFGASVSICRQQSLSVQVLVLAVSGQAVASPRVMTLASCCCAGSCRAAHQCSPLGA